MRWNEPALLTLISDQIEEADQLEYKGARSLKKADRERDEIGKDVSSFANGGGGTTIYGINEFDDAPRRHLPEKFNRLTGQNLAANGWNSLSIALNLVSRT